MDNHMKFPFFVCLGCQLWLTIKCVTLQPIFQHINHSEQKYSEYEYLPPYTTENYVEKLIDYNTNTASQPSYDTQAFSKIFHPITYNNNNNKNLTKTNQPTTKLYNSYAAPASGSASFIYSKPQRANLVPLPELFPKSLIEELSAGGAQQQQQQQIQQLQQQQQFQHQYQQTETHQKYQTHPEQQQQQQQQQQTYMDLPPPSLLMIEEPAATLLTPNQSHTLEAARILASTLLQANGEATLETPGLAPLSKPNALTLPNRLNSTDVLIVKSQKNAYIIPAPLAKDMRNPSKVRALYQMRDKLEKAYTINQFIFIIKPEKINFLNKLV